METCLPHARPDSPPADQLRVQGPGIVVVPCYVADFSFQGSASAWERISRRLLGGRGVTKTQRDELSQNMFLQDVTAKRFRLSADTKVSQGTKTLRPRQSRPGTTLIGTRTWERVWF